VKAEAGILCEHKKYAQNVDLCSSVRMNKDNKSIPTNIMLGKYITDSESDHSMQVLHDDFVKIL